MIGIEFHSRVPIFYSFGGQPDTVCRADLLNRKRLRCKGSNPLPSAQKLKVESAEFRIKICERSIFHLNFHLPLSTVYASVVKWTITLRF